MTYRYLNFKIVVAEALIGRYSNCNRSFFTTRLSKQKTHKPSMTTEVPIRSPEFQQNRMRCHYCKNESSDLKCFVFCQACGLYLCLTKERNCFLNHDLYFSITVSFLIIYLLENRLFSCKLFGFLLFLLCSRICLQILNLTKNEQIQLQSFFSF